MEKEYNGAFIGYVVHQNSAGYYGEFVFANGNSCWIEGGCWAGFRDNVRKACGVELPMRKHWNFVTLSDWEQIAYINSGRQGGCMIPKDEARFDYFSGKWHLIMEKLQHEYIMQETLATVTEEKPTFCASSVTITGVMDFDYTGGGIWVACGTAEKRTKDSAQHLFWVGDIYENVTANEITFYSAYPFEVEEPGFISYIPAANHDDLILGSAETGTEEWGKLWNTIIRLETAVHPQGTASYYRERLSALCEVEMPFC